MAAPEPHGEPLQGLPAMQDDTLWDTMARVDLLDRIRVAGTHASLHRAMPRVNLEVTNVLDMPAVLEDDVSWDVGPVKRGHRRLLTPMDSPTMTMRILDEPPPDKAWFPQYCVGANGDWMAFVDLDGDIHLHNVYSGHNVHLPPVSAQGFEPVRIFGRIDFWYNNVRAMLLKVTITHPPTRRFGYTDFIVIAVFDIAIAVNTGYKHGADRWQIMSPPALAPYHYEDAVYIAGRICAVTTGGSCFVWDPSTYGTLAPPRFLQAPLMHGEAAPPKFWNLVPYTSDHPNNMYLVRSGGNVTGQEQGVVHEDQIVRSYPTLSCQVLRFDGLDGHLQGAQWQPNVDLGSRSLFVGQSYPLMMEIPPADQDGNGLPFLKRGCVFIARRATYCWNGPLPNVCRYSLDGSPTLGVFLKNAPSSERFDHPVCLVPSLRNAADWHEHEGE